MPGQGHRLEPFDAGLWPRLGHHGLCLMPTPQEQHVDHEGAIPESLCTRAHTQLKYTLPHSQAAPHSIRALPPKEGDDGGANVPTCGLGESDFSPFQDKMAPVSWRQ